MLAGTEISRFWFVDEIDRSAFLVFGPIELVNHCRTPNCDRRWTRTEVGEVVTLFAVAPIEPGEQITIDYELDGRPDDTDWA